MVIDAVKFFISLALGALALVVDLHNLIYIFTCIYPFIYFPFRTDLGRCIQENIDDWEFALPRKKECHTTLDHHIILLLHERCLHNVHTLLKLRTFTQLFIELLYRKIVLAGYISENTTHIYSLIIKSMGNKWRYGCLAPPNSPAKGDNRHTPLTVS